jgi:hypothetical protein
MLEVLVDVYLVTVMGDRRINYFESHAGYSTSFAGVVMGVDAYVTF